MVVFNQQGAWCVKYEGIPSELLSTTRTAVIFCKGSTIEDQLRLVDLYII